MRFFKRWYSARDGGEITVEHHHGKSVVWVSVMFHPRTWGFGPEFSVGYGCDARFDIGPVVFAIAWDRL